MNKIFAICILLIGLGCGEVLRAQDEEEFPVETPPSGRSRESRGPGGPGRPGMMRMFPMFAVIDEDENGEISAKELRRAITALKTLDQNEDGKLTEDEVRPQFPGGPGGAGGPGGPGGPGRGGTGGPGGGPDQAGGPNGQGRPPFGPPDPAAMVKRWMEFDADQDGKLSQNELNTMAQQFFRPPQQRQRPSENGPGSRRRGGQKPVEDLPEE